MITLFIFYVHNNSYVENLTKRIIWICFIENNGKNSCQNVLKCGTMKA